MKKTELLAPAGNMEKLRVALRYGADAVYLGGRQFGLRAQADNFSDGEIARAVGEAHALGRRLYVTANIFARNADFGAIRAFFAMLVAAGVDGVIISDLGLISVCRKEFPALDVHVSTQANTTNAFSAQVYADMGVKRIVLARELKLSEIKDIGQQLAGCVELEAFVHGAMCISYSGRCLLSNYLTGRPSNRGACAQACRWQYAMREVSREDSSLVMEEDERGAYILNSKDLMMIEHLSELAAAGVTSFKIEGRMKTAYYVATVVNAYRRAIDCAERGEPVPRGLEREVAKASNRGFTTGFYFGDEQNATDLRSSAPRQDYDFCAVVRERGEGGVWVEMRNRFRLGDELEILSPSELWNRTFFVGRMTNETGETVEDAKRVCERLFVETDLPLDVGDILRKRVIRD